MQWLTVCQFCLAYAPAAWCLHVQSSTPLSACKFESPIRREGDVTAQKLGSFGHVLLTYLQEG